MWKDQALGFIKFPPNDELLKNYFYGNCSNSYKHSQGHIIGINSRIIPPPSEVGVHDMHEGRSGEMWRDKVVIVFSPVMSCLRI